MKTRGERDLTTGSIRKQILLFFIPVFFSSLFQQLYNTADAIIVGQFAGKQALAAIDAGGGLTRLFVNFFVGISSGATIIISQYFGRKKVDDISKIVYTAIALAVTAGIGLTIFGILFSPFCLKLMNVPSDIIGTSIHYTQIYFLGFIASLLYNFGSGILRAVGNTKGPMYFLIISSIINIILDIVFVSLFGWGVIGAASATVLSQIMSAALVLITLSHAPSAYRFSFKKMSFHRSALMNIFILGLPIGLGSCMYPISNIFVHIGVNRFQTDTIAAWAVVGKLDFLIWLIIEAFAVTISTFVAQNYGACCMERVKKGMHFCIALNIVLIAGLSVILYLFAEPLGQLFIHDTAVIAISVDMLRFIAPFYVTFVCGDILAGAIRGTGETFMPMLLTMIGTCALRVFWILIAMPLHFTVFTVIMVYPITWIVTSVLFVFYYRICSRTRLVPEQLYYKRRLLYKKREIM